MKDEMAQLNYHEGLSDFASLVQEQGAEKVAGDFAKAFPQQTAALLSCFNTPNQRQVPALFKP